MIMTITSGLIIAVFTFLLVYFGARRDKIRVKNNKTDKDKF